MTQTERAELDTLAKAFVDALGAELDRFGVEHGPLWAELRVSPNDLPRCHYATVGWGSPASFSANLTAEHLGLASRGNYLWDGIRLDTAGLARRLVDRAIAAGHLTPSSS